MYSLTTDHESHSQPAAVYTTSPVIIAFTLGILICFVVGFCFVYLCRCCFMNALYSWALQHPTSGTLVHRLNSPSATTSPYRGLDPSLLQIFPTFPYASVKDFHGKNKNHSLECAICLLEFEDDSFLRLLTVCCHVFHQECIDLWLGSHKTCPVCRTDLDSPVEKSQENQIISAETSLTTENNDNGNDNNIGVETRIDVKEDDDDGEDEQVSTSLQVGGEGENERFSRSHSTGHSIVVMRGEDGGGRHNQKNDENYTLRLPEHIQVKLIRGGGGGHNYAKSSVTYREMATLCSKCCYAEAISGCSSCEIVRV